MALPPDYEPSIALAAFTAAWRKKFRPQPRQSSSIYSLPDDDCPFENDDQPQHYQANNETRNEVDCQRSESEDPATGPPSLALPDLDDLEQQSPEVSMALAGTFMREAMDKQIKQQDVWNDDMQQRMEAILEHYQKIDSLEEQVAAL
ncbi:uncharacterized protein N7458_004861 [Penicillium daleae]|uniref:Uncharacterized protein n=1 Tax=Penicillium daleae TaxID=63821 RepID=A0AAD6C8P7_9EURO|nr:uncharacterized protein N7458_004861 [Penicillium daleae]KAJ5453905.1 hypothetical protein N7458_004861 [Penicillium daleae]